MKNLNVKHAAISSAVVYVLAILAFVGSFLVPILDDPTLQANMALMIAMVPSAYLGAHLYYRRGHTTGGYTLGFVMFLGAIILDAIITVPVFVIPNGGNHLSFFGDPGFWLIGFEYITVVTAYWHFKVIRAAKANQA
ncbi:MAG: DUF5367 family protein [Ekhidna sp.]|nr:DUF5367 family protein [Ekhidna sp.]